MADETKYKKRPTRKVVRSLRMPASARGGYDVPEEATWEDEEEVAPHMEIDPSTGESYAPRGLEESEVGGPEMLLPVLGAVKPAAQGAAKVAQIIGQKAGKEAARRTFQEAEKGIVKSVPKLAGKELEENLDVFFGQMKQVNPELGEEKGRSVLQKISDPFIDFLEDRKSKKWSEQYSKDRRAYIQQQLDERRKNKFIRAEQKRKAVEKAGTPVEGKTQPPTEIE